MCETRHDLKIARNKYKSTKTDDHIEAQTETKMPRQKAHIFDGKERPRNTSALKVRGERPSDGDKKEWTLVGENAKDIPRPRKSPIVRAT